jgi:biopolymer transport protein ExbD
MSLRRGRARAELMGDINVVSLIDVMMLLLVIFMITAPIMQGGVDVKLPTTAATPIEPKSGLTVTVTATQIFVDQTQIFVDQTPYTDNAFRAAFRTLADTKGKDGVYIRGDGRAPYQRIMTVMGIMIKAGVTNIGLIADSEDGGR